MKRAIRHIDRALKKIYHLEGTYKAEKFLVSEPASPLPGTLYVKAASPTSLSVGIYFHDSINHNLKRLGRWQPMQWSSAQLGAFTTASEEVSHFHYLLHNAEVGRGVSKFEMELQGEVDKFVLAFFAGARDFEALFEQLFYRFHLDDSLSAEERGRYLEANGLARRFIHRFGKDLTDKARRDRVFRLLRRFYRLNTTEKISLISG